MSETKNNTDPSSPLSPSHLNKSLVLDTQPESITQPQTLTPKDTTDATVKPYSPSISDDQKRADEYRILLSAQRQRQTQDLLSLQLKLTREFLENIQSSASSGKYSHLAGSTLQRESELLHSRIFRAERILRRLNRQMAGQSHVPQPFKVDDFLVRVANPNDAESIRNLALSRVVSSSSQSTSGLIDYPVPDVETYRAKIRTGAFSVLVRRPDEMILGFMDVYTRPMAASVFSGDPIFIELEREGDSDYAFFNTIAMHRSIEGTGFRNRLLRFALQQIPQSCNSLYTVIVHAPMPNRTSIQIVKRFGFSCLREFSAFGVVFGLYRSPYQVSRC
ncbi:MAG: hypothetical protein RLY14_1801 [Planctomycetota bacterium]|jgi:hypothetical protein